MGQIRVLSPNLVNRIAAGECVERPASVVKELVENALDAGAGRIDVAILDGGRGLIQVSDDGVGMDVEDLRLSIAPHATSKIQSDEDLFNIHTLGFRGEALASIGAVSRMQITSRRRDSDVGHTIRVEAGQSAPPTPGTASPGTVVAVRDLFYCVPARRKFLRTNPTEMGHISEQFARLALAHPGVAFALQHQGRDVHRLPPTPDRRQRLADFYGPELAGVLLPIGRESGGVRVEGYAAPPAQCRKSAKWEYLFVNGRYVRDRFVSHAVREAYRSLLHPDEHPVAFLFVTIDPGQVDVNVHPTKIEVRWRDSNYVHAQVLAALRERFLSTNLDRVLRPPAHDDEAYRQRVRQAMVDFFTHARPAEVHSGAELPPPARLRGSMAETPAMSGPASGAALGGQGTGTAQFNSASTGNAQDGLDDVRHTGPDAPFPGQRLAASRVGAHGAEPCDQAPTRSAEASGLATEPSALGRVAPRVRALQLHNSYLVAETDDGLMIIDQHALHERILYEELRRRITQAPLESQRLLIPGLVRVPPDRLGVLETHADTLQRLGMHLTPAGPRDVAIQSFPTLLEHVDPETFVRDLLDLLAEVGQNPEAESVVHAVLDLAACKAAVKAGDPLTADEIEALLARRDLAERASHCPHGRPTTLRLSLGDLERQFKRR